MTARLLPWSFSAAVLVVLIVVIPWLAARVARRLNSFGSSDAGKISRFARTMLILWAISGLAFLALSLHAQSPADVGWRPPHERWEYLLGLLAAVVPVSLTASTAPRLSREFARRIAIVIPATPYEWRWFLAVAITAGVCEEFLYRGYALTIITMLSHSLGAGVLFSTAAFTLAHRYQGAGGMVSVALIGVVYALLVVATGSLWPAMTAHALQNLASAALLSKRVHGAAAPG